MVFNLNADCTIEQPLSNMSMFDSAGWSTKMADYGGFWNTAVPRALSEDTHSVSSRAALGTATCAAPSIYSVSPFARAQCLIE